MKNFYTYLTLLFPLFALSQAGSESSITTITSSLTYQGYEETLAHAGTGEYKIYYDNIDGVLDKPIFFVDGFDPGDSRTIPLMYSLLDYGSGDNLADAIRDEGFDIVVLNFPTYTSTTDGTTIIDGGGDYIQRNAFILIELINTINAMKSGNDENVVIGPSMGGLISRYALRYMEENSLDHETRLFISFDAPHLGANVPIGMQYLFNYMVNGDPAITEAAPLVDGLLNSAAAKQMLIDHYLGHLASGSDFEQDPNETLPVGAPNFRDAFQTELDAMGFPQNVRNVAISNGSSEGELTGTPGMELINHTFDTGNVGGFDTQAIMNVHFTPIAGETIEVTNFIAQFYFFGWINAFTYSAQAESMATTDGLDSAPGGQFDLYSFDDGTNDLITEFVANLNSQYFCFIPTLSSLAITDTNWYTNPNVSNSPFDNTFIPESNEPHVTLTPENVSFVSYEILNETLSSEAEQIHPEFIKLQRNPTQDKLVLLSNKNHPNTQIQLIDVTGKMILQDYINLEKTTNIPIKFSPGMYILQIVPHNSPVVTIKVVIK